MEWSAFQLNIEGHADGILVVDAKVRDVSGDEYSYVVRGWRLANPEHLTELKRFVECCTSRGFTWALQDGHPDPRGRVSGGHTRRYLSFGRAYAPQPSWDVACNNPGGRWYIIEERHRSCLIECGIHFEVEAGAGHNLKIDRATLELALDAINSGQESQSPREMREDVAEQRINEDVNLSATNKDALVKARRGQGLFRRRVLAIEPYCRLTGVSDARFLRASHIKPWVESNDMERLDGNNGLMLAPHVDQLFDQGYISFTKAGELLVAECAEVILQAWALPRRSFGGSFNEKQEHYLSYHRRHCFLGAVLE
jgi:hypothetical protein